MMCPTKSIFKDVSVHLVLLLLYVCLSIRAAGQGFDNQTYSRTYIDVTAGLSNNYVTNIIEDDFGFKWMATEGGLNKYDGRTFKVFKPSNTPALKNENIEVVFRDADGDLWIGTKSGGLTYYDGTHESFTNYNNYVFASKDDKSLRIHSIAQSGDNKMFVGTWSDGLYVFDKDSSDEVTHYLDGKIDALEADGYGNLWVSDGKWLHKYDPSEKRLVRIGDYGTINDMVYDAERDRLWLGISGKGIFYVDMSDHSYRISPNIYSSTYVYSLAVDKEGRILVGTWRKGLFISDTTGQSFSRYSLLQPSDRSKNTSYEAILDIHLDDNDIIWISTAFGGVVKLMPVNNFQGLTGLFQSDVLSDYNIHALAHDTAGRLWIGTYGAGVTMSDHGSLVLLDNIPITKVNTYEEIGPYMFVGGREGLYRVPMDQVDRDADKFYSSLRHVTALHLAQDGRLWVGTQQSGLFYVENALGMPGRLITPPSWPKVDRISQIVEDSNGNLWIGTFKGLFLFDHENETFVSANDLLQCAIPSNIINDIFIDKDLNKLWLGMSGGLVEVDFDGTTITNCEINSTDKGLRNEFITSVLGDEQGNLWAGTAHGLAKYLPDRKVFENFGTADGVPVQSFNIKSATQSKDGLMMFGATNGIVAFDPTEITLKRPNPLVTFTDLIVNGQVIDVGDRFDDQIVLPQSLQYTSKVVLTSQANAVSFNVSTLDYLSDDNVLFSYRLIGLNESWSIPSANNQIGFINLGTGEYTLEVRASRDNFHWSKAVTKHISIPPPLWARWYAYLAYFTFLAVVAYLALHITRKQAQLRTKIKVAQVAKEKEHDLAEAKITFFTNISHEFRSPLTMILSPITEVLLDESIRGKIRERLTAVEVNANRLLSLVNQLLDFRKSENGLLQLKVAPGDLVSFSKEVFLSFRNQANAKKISYSFSCEEDGIVLPFDRDKMEIVLVNLLSNSFKYTSEQGRIELAVQRVEGNCEITIRDSGIGIEPKELAKIFDRFYQINTAQSAKLLGSGIGLSLAKNIVELHHGKISVSSTPNEGSSFKICVPINNSKFTPDEYIRDFKSSDDPSSYPEVVQKDSPIDIVNHNHDQDKDAVLVVDDNDEIRRYLSSLMTEEGYDVITASDGLEALHLANEMQPDIIISDIMMPEMDGITFCSTIKNDFNTSHIPVILLTARTSTVFEVSGLQTGADDYIRKPFHPTVVKTRVNAMIENRRKVREYFVRRLRFEPGNAIEASSAEELFIQKAIDLIQENILDSEFGIDSLMDHLAMSKSSLYRKLKSLTGLSITAFIRSVKLKKAAELILTVDWKLSQIAHESGFNDYKYFNTCFREQFGCLPSQYREQKSMTIE